MAAAADRSREVIVIGYGNELRGDDGAGPAVIAQLEQDRPPNVQLISTHQLAPEFSPALADARAVFFVDARCDRPEIGVQWESLDQAVAPPDSIGHVFDPRALLVMAEMLFERRPPAWLVTLPAENFEFGTTLSQTARRGVRQAAAEICQRIKELACTN